MILTLLACFSPTAGIYEMSGEGLATGEAAGWPPEWEVDPGPRLEISDQIVAFRCARSGETFTCEEEVASWDRDTCYEGCTDAVITTVDVLEGHFTAVDAFRATRRWEADCAGVDCGEGYPSVIEGALAGVWVAESWEAFAAR